MSIAGKPIPGPASSAGRQIIAARQEQMTAELGCDWHTANKKEPPDKPRREQIAKTAPSQLPEVRREPWGKAGSGTPRWR